MTDRQQDIQVSQGQEADFPLHGERVWLRPPQMSDARYVFHWERDDEVWRYDPYRPYSRTMKEFLPTFERNYVRGTGARSGLSSRTSSIHRLARSPILTSIYAPPRQKWAWALAIKRAGAWAMELRPFALWSSISSGRRVLSVSTRKRPWLMRLRARHSPELVLLKSGRFLILVAQETPGFFSRYGNLEGNFHTDGYFTC